MKSYTSIEQHVCVICGHKYETGSVLLDKRLKDSFEMHTVTKEGICGKCEEQCKKYVLLVVCDESKSGDIQDGKIKPGDVWRTGEIIQVKKSALGKIFNIPINTKFCFINQESANKLKSMIS
jgi:hypothetical protein